MAYSEKFYYIDEDNKKKKYVGKVIYNNDGTFNGILTKSTQTICSKPLIHHPEVEKVDGYFAYFSYITNDGSEVRYFDTIKRDANGDGYFTYTEKNMLKLDYNPEVPEADAYFTYIDPETNQECKYEGSVVFNRKSNTYTGIITK